uniref:Neprosin PEP catalytic domain-containing protein n=2 Tax=Aegilops tauschii subsp. strangulata TaxID=200361 RepID=A0A453MX03_AEGTS
YFLKDSANIHISLPPKMMKHVYIFLVLFTLCLDKVSTAWCHNPYLRRHKQLEKGASSSERIIPIEDELQAGEIVEHIAAYQTPPNSTMTLYGAMATLDVYECLAVKAGQIVSAEIWVENYQKEKPNDVNVVQVGWNIQPSYYGDNKTHFLIGWTANGNKTKGCFDLKCDGFVPVKNPPITPGGTLEGKTKISIKIFKSKKNGDWSLHFAHVGEKFAPVGFWPRSLFESLSDHANYVTWGGYTSSLVRTPSPPMGNGRWPEGDSASFQNVQYVNNDGHGYLPMPNLHSRVTDAACYRVSEFRADKFSYGGPGGCVN